MGFPRIDWCGGGSCVGGVGTAVFLPELVWFSLTANMSFSLRRSDFSTAIRYGVNATYMTESFETNVAQRRSAALQLQADVGAAVGPALIGLIATNYSIGLGLAVMAGAYVLTAAIQALGIREKISNPQERNATGQLL